MKPTFYCKVCKNPYKHRGGNVYYCKTCDVVHIIARWPSGHYIEDAQAIPPPTEAQKEEFWKELEKQGVKRPGK